MRTSKLLLNQILKNQLIETFSQTISDFKDTKELLIFLKDFFNDGELETFAKRLGIAYWLTKGRSYENIRENLKVSSATIASVQTTLAKPGVKLAIKKIEAEEWANKWSEKIQKFVRK